MMNVYNGNTVLNSAGENWVQLPDYFDALNREFRYQLTAIGSPGPNLHVAQEISVNRFKVAGGRPGGKVSWQVTLVFGRTGSPQRIGYRSKRTSPRRSEEPTYIRGSSGCPWR